MKQIQANFQGYWREANKDSIPAEAGVYCVYACTHIPSNNELAIRELLYIGESLDVKARIANHNKRMDWYSRLYPGETLCYSFAKLGYLDREQCEAALISHHKPPLNIEYIFGFPYEPTIVQTYGNNIFLDGSFTAA